jgi:CHAT domain-containing protein/tetratricopeptide (TPR) repeat protein
MPRTRIRHFGVATAAAHRTALGIAFIVAATWSAPPAQAASPRDRWPSTRYAPLLVRADSLRGAGLARVHGYLDSLIVTARARGDTDLEMVASIRDASIRGFIESAFDSSVAVSRRWLDHARATHDTLSWCLALRTIGYADLARERWATSLVTYRQMLPLALRARLPVPEGYARIGISFIAIQRGDFAEAQRGYAIAVRRLEARDPYGARTARAGLAHALLRQGMADEARHEYERVVTDSRAARDLRNESEALNDLGVIEAQYGDPSLAEPIFHSTARMFRSMGLRLRALQSTRNAALCLASAGRLEEECTLMDSVARGAESLGAADLAAICLGDLSLLRRRQGRYAEARAYLQRAPVSQGALGIATWLMLVTERVRLETQSGRPESAAQMASRALDSLAAKGDPSDRAGLLVAQGLALIASGDPADAIMPLRESVSLLRRPGDRVVSGSITCESTLGYAFVRLGRRDSALVHYQRAASVWEQSRAAPSDLAWRQAFDRLPGELFGPFAAVLLDPGRGGTAGSRAAECFAMVQRFRARTLEDLLRGAQGRAELPRVSVAQLRRTLRPGEVLLDVFVTPDTTYLFAATRDTIRVGGTSGSTRLVPRLRRFRDLVASGGSDEPTISAAAAELGDALLGPVAESLRQAKTVLLSAGSLAAFPLGMLRLPGEDGTIAARHGLAVVPSATLLAATRSARADGLRRSTLMALSRTTDAEGVRLEGVARESRWLARRFPGARIVTNDGSRPLDEMLAALGPSEVLHVSSHARTPSAAPWSSGFLLGRGAGSDAYLTASRISRLRPHARVCVLASCTSVGAANGGEGLPDLASAWLEAGTSTVIGTLWKVGDQETARFVEDFYEALARGATTGEATRTAQHAAIVSRDRSAERFWGGFVLFGDPTTRVELATVKR